MHDLLCVHCGLWLLEGKALARRQVFVSPLLKRLHIHYDHYYLAQSPCIGCKLINKAVRLMPGATQTGLPEGADVQVVPFDYSVPGYDTRDIRFILDCLPITKSGGKVWRSCLWIDNVHHSLYMHFEARYAITAEGDYIFISVDEYVKPRFDMKLIRRWLDICGEIHKEEDSHSPPSTSLSPGIRLVDLQNRCLVTPLNPNELRFVTFVSKSEIWPYYAAQHDQYTTFGSLDHPSIPKRLQDSMDFCRQLGETYMWIECLCMSGPPETPNDQLAYNQYLQSLSASARWSLVCALDGKETQNLPGYKQDREWKSSVELRNGSYGSNEIHTYGSIYDAAEATSHGFGKWVPADQTLSTRRVFITPNQVLFQCKCGLAQEYLTWSQDSTDNIETLDQSFLKTKLPLSGVAAIRAFLTDSETKAQITSDQEALEYLDSMSQKNMEAVPSIKWHDTIQLLKKPMEDKTDIPGWIVYSQAAFATQTYIDSLQAARRFFQCTSEIQILMLRLRYCKWSTKQSLLPSDEIFESILAAERLFRDVQISYVAEQKVVKVHHILSLIWVFLVRGFENGVDPRELDKEQMNEVITCISGLFAWRRHFEVYDETQLALEGLQALMSTAEGSTYKVMKEFCLAIKTTQSFIGRLWRLYQHFDATIVEESRFRQTDTLYLLFDNLTDAESRVFQLRKFCSICKFTDTDLDKIISMLDPPDIILPDMQTLPYVLEDIMNVFRAVDACDWYGDNRQLLRYLGNLRQHPSRDESIDIIIDYIDKHPHHTMELEATQGLLSRYPPGDVEALDPLGVAKRKVESLKQIVDSATRAAIIDKVLQKREEHFRDLWMLSKLYSQVYEIATCCGSWSRTKALLEGLRVLGEFANSMSHRPGPRDMGVSPVLSATKDEFAADADVVMEEIEV